MLVELIKEVINLNAKPHSMHVPPHLVSLNAFHELCLNLESVFTLFPMWNKAKIYIVQIDPGNSCLSGRHVNVYLSRIS